MSDNKPSRLSFATLTKNFVQDFVSADRGMLGTLINLSYRPGRVVKTFLYEDRGRFIRPTKYVLFTVSALALVYVIVQLRYGMPLHEYLAGYYAEYVDGMMNDMRVQMLANEQLSATPEGREFVGTYVQWWRDASYSLMINSVKYSTYYGMATIPFQTLLLWLVFPRRGFNLAETLAGTSYIVSHSGLLAVLMLPVILFVNSPELLTIAMQPIGFLQFAYLLFAIIHVFVRDWGDVLRAFGILVLLIIWFAGLAGSLIYLGGYFYGRTACSDCSMPLSWYATIVIPIAYFVLAYLALRWRLGTWKKPLRWALGASLLVAIVGMILI